MAFESRSYGGKLFRPAPKVHFEESQNLLIVATAWGEPTVADHVVQTMLDYFMSALDDFEATSPFEKMSCLSPTANHLRIACLIANDYVYREINRSEYQSGLEIFASALVDNELTFVQLGLPHILLVRENRGTTTLGSSMDLSFDFSDDKDMLPPLPSQLMGLDPTCHLTVNSMRPHEGDRVLLVSRSHLPSSLFSLSSSNVTLNETSRILAKDNVDMPFWLGLYTFGESAVE